MRVFAFLDRLDAALLGRVAQPVSDALSAWTEPLRVARVLLHATVVLYLAAVAMMMREASPPILTTALTPAVMWMVVQDLRILPAQARAPNPLRAQLWLKRLLWLTSSATDAVELAVMPSAAQGVLTLSGLCWVAALYLASCDRPPPRRVAAPRWAAFGAA